MNWKQIWVNKISKRLPFLGWNISLASTEFWLLRSCILESVTEAIMFFSALSPQLYKLNIHNVVSEFVPLIMNTIMLQVSPQARWDVCVCVCVFPFNKVHFLTAIYVIRGAFNWMASSHRVADDTLPAKFKTLNLFWKERIVEVAVAGGDTSQCGKRLVLSNWNREKWSAVNLERMPLQSLAGIKRLSSFREGTAVTQTSKSPMKNEFHM